MNNTKVLRSIGTGTKRVNHCLNAWRAMIVCWIAKSPSSPMLIATAAPTLEGAAPLSIALGTTPPPTKPIM